MELYNPIYGDLFEFSISIISFMNVINSILKLQHSIYGDQYGDQEKHNLVMEHINLVTDLTSSNNIELYKSIMALHE